MERQKFKEKLIKGLHGVPREEAAKLVGYYDEIIRDRIESGENEVDIIDSLGDPSKIASDFMVEQDIAVKENRIKKLLHNRTFWIVYFSGFIITFPLTVALFAVLCGLFGIAVGLFGVLIAVFCVVGSLFICSFAFVIGGILGLFSMVFGLPSTLPVGLVGIGGCLAVIAIGIILYPVALHLMKLSIGMFNRKKPRVIQMRAKKQILISTPLFIAAVVVFCVGMSMLDWNFVKLDTHIYEDKVYVFTQEEADSITSLEIRLGEDNKYILKPLDNEHNSITIEYRSVDGKAPVKWHITDSGELLIQWNYTFSMKDLSIFNNNWRFGERKPVIYYGT